MKKSLKKIIPALIIFAVFFLVKKVLADTNSGISFTPNVPFGDFMTGQMTITDSSLGQYVKAMIAFVSAIIVVIAILMIMFSGIQWILAAGDSGKISKAKDDIKKAIIGLVIALFSVFILQIVNPQTTIFNPLNPETIKTVTTAAEGAPCTSSSGCASGLFCNQSGVCAKKLITGADCLGATLEAQNFINNNFKGQSLQDCSWIWKGTGAGYGICLLNKNVIAPLAEQLQIVVLSNSACISNDCSIDLSEKTAKCSSSSTKTGTLGLGETCGASNDCQPTYYCNKLRNNICQKRSDLGSYCTSTAEIDSKADNMCITECCGGSGVCVESSNCEAPTIDSTL